MMNHLNIVFVNAGEVKKLVNHIDMVLDRKRLSHVRGWGQRS